MRVQAKIGRIRKKLRVIVFGTHIRAGRRFDMVLLWSIILSVVLVILESEPSLKADYGSMFKTTEWIFTIVFSLEYILRILISDKPRSYIFSFFGLVDFISVAPTFLELLLPGAHSLLVVRMLRVLRVFRILKMAHYLKEAKLIMETLKASLYKIMVFIFGVLILVTIMGTLMYVIESSESGFTSIPTSVYWAIVTITTMGYGDIAPVSSLGKMLASCIMLMGYAIIAVPTGLVTAEFVKRAGGNMETKDCPGCKQKIDKSAKYCAFCGTIQ